MLQQFAKMKPMPPNIQVSQYENSRKETDRPSITRLYLERKREGISFKQFLSKLHF